MAEAPNEDEDIWLAQLEKLREPFPPERIEKLPKPTFKDAWKDQPKAHCEVCGGYHSTRNVIHLDYVGHANCTARLLDVDPCWDWEPMAYTEEGLPLFSQNGLWIKLTVCGVTRIGFGDGASVKEVIGDAIRNAAMRFGVALDLWSKVDLHEAINPEAPGNQRNANRASPRGDGAADQPAPAAAPRPNQAALDALESVCKKHGYSTQYCIDRFFSDYDIELKDAAEELIFAFADVLIGEATGEPAAGQQPVDASGGDRPADDATVPAAGDGDGADGTAAPGPDDDDPPF